jgi:hypothetical protein
MLVKIVMKIALTPSSPLRLSIYDPRANHYPTSPSTRQYTIDAFTKKHYKGNSAAVVIMPPSVDFNWDIPFMHNVSTPTPSLSVVTLLL